MEVVVGEIPGLMIFKPRKFQDERGYFMESFNQRQFNEAVGKEVIFVQDNESVSKKDVVRGLHLQENPSAQGKLVRVTKGKVLDVAVDLRKDSPYYGQYQMVELSEENGVQFWIPEGFAHGFVALEEGTQFLYKCTQFYDKETEVCILWNDPAIKIDWKVQNPIVSLKDQEGILLQDYHTPFIYTH